MVYLDKGSFAGSELVIVRPTSNFRVEDSDEVSRGRLSIVLDDFSDFGKEGFDVFPGGFHDDFSMVLADSLS